MYVTRVFGYNGLLKKRARLMPIGLKQHSRTKTELSLISGCVWISFNKMELIVFRLTSETRHGVNRNQSITLHDRSLMPFRDICNRQRDNNKKKKKEQLMLCPAGLILAALPVWV